MLSYRHGYHAGNHADLLKHLVEVQILQALAQKAKPFCYIDSHAAGGYYDLRGDFASKNAEFETGIGCLWNQAPLPEALLDYLEVVRALNPDGNLRYYPGSPAFARQLLRPDDRGWLFELHNREVDVLRGNFADDARFQIRHEDGFAGLKALLPPPIKRGLVLIDPPYELKTDYQSVVHAVREAHKRFATGIYAIWYPLLRDNPHQALLQGLERSGIRRQLRLELSIAPEGSSGMRGSGMLVINPPWQLDETFKQLLPALCPLLGTDSQYRVQWQVGE